MRQHDDGYYDCGLAYHDHTTHEAASACMQQRIANAIEDGTTTETVILKSGDWHAVVGTTAEKEPKE